MSQNSGKKNRPSLFLIIFLIILTGSFVTLLITYFIAQVSRERSLYESEVTILAELKASEVETWYLEVQSDADFIYSDTSLQQTILDYSYLREDSQAKKKLEQWMQYQLRKPNYSSIFLVDNTGNILLQVDDAKEKSREYNFLTFATSLNSKQVESSDLYASSDETIRMDVSIPIIRNVGKSKEVIATIILQLDPNEKLFPIIKNIPSNSETLETLMVRRDGGDIVYITPLKFINNVPLKLRLPATNQNLVAAVATRSFSGVINAVDYRNEKVTAAYASVNNTPWKLIAKIDRSEVFSHLRTQAWILGIALIVTVLAAAMGLVLLWRQQSSKYYKGLYEKEVERQNLENRYSALFNQASDAILLMSPDGKIINANEKAVNLYGYTKDELLNLKIFDLREKSSLPFVEADMKAIREKKETYFETVHKKKSGEKIYVEVSSRFLSFSDESFFQSLIRDITERKEAEHQLKYSELELKKAQQIAQVGSFTWNGSTREIEWSDEMYRIYGFDKSTHRPEKFDISTHPDDKERVINEIDEGIKSGKKFAFDYRIIHPDGAIRELHTEVGEIILNQDGSLKSLSGTVQDITETKTIERELRRRENQLSKIFEILPVGLEILDKDGSIIQSNRAMNEILDSTTNIESKQDDKILNDWARIRSLQEGATIKGETMEIEVNHKQKTIINYSTPIYDDNHILEGAVVVNLDISELKEAERQLQDQLDELRRWNLATLGREKRIQELKKEINSILKDHGAPAKYNSVEESNYV